MSKTYCEYMDKYQMNSLFYYLEQDKNINNIYSLIHLFVCFQQVAIGPLLYAEHGYTHWGYSNNKKCLPL